LEGEVEKRDADLLNWAELVDPIDPLLWWELVQSGEAAQARYNLGMCIHPASQHLPTVRRGHRDLYPTRQLDPVCGGVDPAG
jgi:hypothetical protein